MRETKKYLPPDECNLNLIKVFKNLSPEELNHLYYNRACSFNKKGSIIFKEGSRINGFFTVHSGVLKLYMTGIDGKEQIIRFAKKGDIIGYRSALSNEIATITAEVIEDSNVSFFAASILLDLFKNNSVFALDISRSICHELAESYHYIINIAQRTVKERLAETLLHMKETFQTDDEKTIQISLTREEIANVVGTATESVIRLISELREEKIIESNGKKIRILNEEALIRLANFS